MHGSSGSCSSFSGEIQLGFTPLPHSKKLVANPGFSLPPRNSFPFGKDGALRLTNISMTRTSFGWLTQETDFTTGWNIKHEWNLCHVCSFRNLIPMPFSEYQNICPPVMQSSLAWKLWHLTFCIIYYVLSWHVVYSIRMCRDITMHHDR